MSKKIPYTQDMPPTGGYKPLQIARVNTYTPKAWVIGALIIASVPLAVMHHVYRRKKTMAEFLADDEGRLCLEPLIQAEQDRQLLWQMRRNREEENKLMKNVPGWKTGTYFGEPIYKTNPNYDHWVNPTFHEVYAHTRFRDLQKAKTHMQKDF